MTHLIQRHAYGLAMGADLIRFGRAVSEVWRAVGAVRVLLRGDEHTVRRGGELLM